jgi:hypothetical protein
MIPLWCDVAREMSSDPYMFNCLSQCKTRIGLAHFLGDTSQARAVLCDSVNVVGPHVHLTLVHNLQRLRVEHHPRKLDNLRGVGVDDGLWRKVARCLKVQHHQEAHALRRFEIELGHGIGDRRRERHVLRQRHNRIRPFGDLDARHPHDQCAGDAVMLVASTVLLLLVVLDDEPLSSPCVDAECRARWQSVQRELRRVRNSSVLTQHTSEEVVWL